MRVECVFCTTVFAQEVTTEQVTESIYIIKLADYQLATIKINEEIDQ